MNDSPSAKTASSDTPAYVRAHSQSTLVSVDVAGLTHPGKVRVRNEDHFLISRFGRFLETLQTNLPAEDVEPSYGEAGYGLVVADGMGGHAAGDEASRLAITILTQLVLATPDWVLRLDDEVDVGRIVQRTEERFAEASRQMTRQAELDPNLHGFGTTLTLAMSLGRELFVFYVGDSRAYLLRHGQLHQLTRDHTSAQVLLDAGLIQAEDLKTHRWRNRLTKLLGDRASHTRPDVHRLILDTGDCLLMCTDGVTDMVNDVAIAETLSAGKSAAETCQSLIDQALAGGGRDNITAIVARYESFAGDA